MSAFWTFQRFFDFGSGHLDISAICNVGRYGFRACLRSWHLDFNVFRNTIVMNNLSPWRESRLTMLKMALRTQLRLIRYRYRKVESAYQCCQLAFSWRRLLDGTSFKHHWNIDRPIPLYDNGSLDPNPFRQIFWHTPVDFGVLHPHERKRGICWCPEQHQSTTTFRHRPKQSQKSLTIDSRTPLARLGTQMWACAK